jgi:hypothetical protein
VKSRKLCALIALLSALGLSASANALTLGKVAPPGGGGCTSCESFQRDVAAGQPSYRVPAGIWTITSWSAQGGGSAAGQARLRVYRPTGKSGQFKLVKQSKFETIPANGHPSFATSLNVQGGDLLGLVTVSGVGTGYPSITGNEVSNVPCAPKVGQLVGKGTTCLLSSLPNHLVNVSAHLVQR